MLPVRRSLRFLLENRSLLQTVHPMQLPASKVPRCRCIGNRGNVIICLNLATWRLRIPLVMVSPKAHRMTFSKPSITPIGLVPKAKLLVYLRPNTNVPSPFATRGRGVVHYPDDVLHALVSLLTLARMYIPLIRLSHPAIDSPIVLLGSIYLSWENTLHLLCSDLTSRLPSTRCY